MAQEIKSIMRYIRTSPQKVRKIVDVVKKKPVERALNTLELMPQKVAKILFKGIASAIANAEQLQGVNIDSLIVLNVTADRGPSFKRYRARARGRGSKIIKRTSHITITLTERVA